MSTRRVPRAKTPALPTQTPIAPAPSPTPPTDVRIPIKARTRERLLELSFAANAAAQRYNDAIKTIMDENDIEEGVALMVSDNPPFELVVRLPPPSPENGS